LAPRPGFGLDNLPFGVARVPGAGSPHVVVAFEGGAIDLAVLHHHGVLDSAIDPAALASASLNRFLMEGPDAWHAVRSRLRQILADPGSLPAGARASLEEIQLLLPVEAGDFVDGYGGLHHATNLGRILRPDGPPLLPNWRHLPVAYHGRSATVVPSGTPVARPWGQCLTDAGPELVPTTRLDIELEVAFVVGVGSPLGQPIAVDDAGAHIFGLVLLNDWSARDIQAYEYQPLGPFLAKSFATSISHWVVTLDALEPFLVGGLPAAADPAPAPYLRTQRAWVPDLHLAVCLQTVAMAAAGQPPAVISQIDFADAMYWSMAQQLAHATINGAATRPGDLFGSGTASGADPSRAGGSLMELSWGGTRPFELPNGEQRAFLEDGDTVILRGWCGGTPDAPTIAFGDVVGTIMPARAG
jgi:fumarylacetoacetase